jgi:hypothetical protein
LKEKFEGKKENYEISKSDSEIKYIELKGKILTF